VGLADEIDPLASEWDELADREGAPPFLRPAWVAAWWRSFGAGKLEIVTARRGTDLIGLLPLARRRGTRASPANYHTPVFGLLAADDAAAADLARAAIDDRATRIDLPFCDRGDALGRAFTRTAEEAGWRSLVRSQTRTPVLTLDGDWKSYAASLGKGLRTSLRRSHRGLEELGPVSIQEARGTTRVKEAFEEFVAVEGMGWKASHGTAVSSRPRTLRFYEEVTRWAAEVDMWRAFFLRLAGRAIAVIYSLEASGVRYLLKGGYDPQYRGYSPGILLLRECLERSFSAGLRRVELGPGTDPYKMRWTDEVHERVLMQTFRGSPTGLLKWSAFAYGRPLAKRLLRRASDREAV
jgi:CelD/BcsL family acetyltransferase involved in cellulose biosynthesis